MSKHCHNLLIVTTSCLFLLSLGFLFLFLFFLLSLLFSFFNFPNSKTNQPAKMAVSKIRQNYHEDCEALINKQINMEFYASYVYLSMSSFFNRDDQALHGFA